MLESSPPTSPRKITVAGIIIGLILILFLGAASTRYLAVRILPPDIGNAWAPLVVHSENNRHCYDDGGSSGYCEGESLTKSTIAGYLTREALPTTTAVFSCKTGDIFQVTKDTDRCQSATPYRLGYTFTNAEDVPDQPAVKFTACHTSEGTRLAINGACNQSEKPEELGYAAPAGESYYDLCLAVKQACEIADLSDLCEGTLLSKCGDTSSVSPEPSISPNPSQTITPSPSPDTSISPPPAISPSPSPALPMNHLIFVTNDPYKVGPDGFIGFSGANSICQQEAASRGIYGNFKAILSDSQTDARDRIYIGGTVKNLEGEVVADNAADLWKGSVQAPVRYIVYGSDNNVYSWTGTNEYGAKDGHPDTTYCQDWSARSPDFVRAGNNIKSDGAWIGGRYIGCSARFPLYCISQ